MPTATIDPMVRQLTELRHRIGLGATELSRRCNFAPSQINMYESGARVPPIDRLRRWARELGAEPILKHHAPD